MAALVLSAALALAPGAPVRQARLLLEDAAPRDQLAAGITRLDATRPSFGAPILLLSIGAGTLLLGGFLGTTGLSSLAVKALLTPTQQTTAGVLLISGITVFLIGATLAIIGTIVLIKRFAALKVHNAELEEARKKLDQLNEDAPPPPVPLTLLAF